MTALKSMTKGLANFFKKPDPIDTAETLAVFLDQRASFLCQKGVAEFCRVRSGAHVDQLFRDEEFMRLLNKAVWTSYPYAFAMVAEMTDGYLREAAGLRQRELPAALTDMAEEIFARYDVPTGHEADFWAKALDLVRGHLAGTQAGSPRPVRDMPDPMARKIYEALPLHQDVIKNDYDYIFNFMRMNLLRAREDLENRADAGAVAADLLGPHA